MEIFPILYNMAPELSAEYTCYKSSLDENTATSILSSNHVKMKSK